MNIAPMWNSGRRTFLTDLAADAVAPVVASDLIGHGFSAALRTRPSAEVWQGTLTAYGRDYMTAGAAEIQRRLAADLVVLQQQLDTPVMWDAASRLMVLYGKTFPGSDGAKAAYWYRMAATAADRGGDLRTRVWVRGGLRSHWDMKARRCPWHGCSPIRHWLWTVLHHWAT